MKNSKMKKFLVMMVAAVMTLGLLVPVSGAAQLTEAYSTDFSSDFKSGTWGTAGEFYVDKGTVNNDCLNAASAQRMAEYYMPLATHESEKVVLSFDVTANKATSTLLWVYAGSGTFSGLNIGSTEIYKLILDESGGLFVNGYSSAATYSGFCEAGIKDGATVSLRMTFDMVQQKVTLQYKNSTAADYTTFSQIANFENELSDGAYLSRFNIFGAKLGDGGSYSIDNFKVSYQLPEVKEDTDLVKVTDEDFSSPFESKYGAAGAFELKNNGSVTNGRLESSADRSSASELIANYWFPTETYDKNDVIVSFDLNANNINSTTSTFMEFWAGNSTTEPDGAGSQRIGRLHINKNDGYLYVNGTSAGSALKISGDNVVNLKLAFDMSSARTVTVSYKKSGEAAYTVLGTFNDESVDSSYVLKKVLFYHPKSTAAGFYIDNFVVAYKNSETKIEADLTVKDSGGVAVSDITNIAAGKMLTVTPKFTNVGSKDAESAVFIVAWYNKDGKLKKAVANEVTAGLAADASYTDMEDITFTEATEEGDYIRAFAWNSLTDLQPYKMAE